jgi:hypothetical protein
VANFVKSVDLDNAYPRAAPSLSAIKTAVLLAALLAYAAGFVILYPLAASSVAKRVAEGADPALMQFVAP